jgi:hypothetical protein
MAIPPFGEKTLKTEKPSPNFRLVKISSIPNGISDPLDWAEKNGLSFPYYSGTDPYMDEESSLGRRPATLPERFEGTMLLRAIPVGNDVLLIYGQDFSSGRYLIVADLAANKVLNVFDFGNYILPPHYKPEDARYVREGLTWAAKDKNILFVSHTHPTYAATSGGQNAYISAIDLSTNELIWRTRPLVSNSYNFLVLDEVIVTGYGFTREPDFLYILRKDSGVILAQIKLKTGPNYILEKKGRIHVHCYDTDYVFSTRGH